MFGNIPKDREIRKVKEFLASVYSVCRRIWVKLRPNLHAERSFNKVSSEPNRGSVFSVLVPRAPMPSGREVALRASVDARHHTVLPAMDVLVLDDEVNILQGMRVLLSDWGCVPTCCATYEAAMATLRDGLQPCAIIADFRLRGASTGYDLIRDARALLGAGLPSVLVTGDIGAQRLREAEAAGIPILRKPVPPAKLLSFLRSAARTAQALSAVS